MGLDIRAYRRLAEENNTKALDSEDFVSFSEAESWPGRLQGLKEGQPYSHEEQFHFYAGSYIGYNCWRNDLARLAGYPLEISTDLGFRNESYCLSCWRGTQGPFADLINFSDCDGTIGPVVSAKLAADFAAFQERADTNQDSAFNKTYANFRKAFEMATDGGAVDFG